jgi:hypothetical protein
MRDYPSFDISVDLGQSLWVKGGDDAGQAVKGQIRVDTSKPKANEVAAEVLFKLAHAILAGDVSISLNVQNSTILRDPGYKFPS